MKLSNCLAPLFLLCALAGIHGNSDADVTGYYLDNCENVRIQVTGPPWSITAEADYSWSPAYGSVAGNTLTMNFGGVNLTATYNGTSLAFSNGCTWQKDEDVTGDYIDNCENLPIQVTGTPGEIIAETDYSWSPAHGSVTGNTLTMNFGGVILTATYDGTSLAFSNGCTWYKDADVTGYYTDNCENIPVQVTGPPGTIVANADYSWSPADGSVTANILTMDFGGVSLTATYDGSSLAFSNGCTWQKGPFLLEKIDEKSARYRRQVKKKSVGTNSTS